VTESLLAGDSAAAASRLQERVSDPQLPAWLRPVIQALQAIVAGSRDCALADTPGIALHDGRRNTLPARNAQKSPDIAAFNCLLSKAGLAQCYFR
jgi:hypothetical protein